MDQGYTVKSKYKTTDRGSIISTAYINTKWGDVQITPAHSIMTKTTVDEESLKSAHIFNFAMKILSVLLLFYLCDICLTAIVVSSCFLFTVPADYMYYGTRHTMKNPMVGTMIGFATCCLFQSNVQTILTIHSLIMVNAVSIQHAVPMVIGSRSGSTIVCTMIALFYIRDRNYYRRMFAVNAVDWIFDWILIAVLMPLEALTGFLYSISTAIADTSEKGLEGINIPLPFSLTKPLVNFILQINSLDWHIAMASHNTSEYTTFLKSCNSEDGKIECYYIFNISLPDAVIGAIVVEIAVVLLLFFCFLIKKMFYKITTDRVATKYKDFGTNFGEKVKRCGHILAFFVGASTAILLETDSGSLVVLMQLAGNRFIPLHIAHITVMGSNLGSSLIELLEIVHTHKDKVALQLGLCHFFGTAIIALLSLLPCLPGPLTLAYHFSNFVGKYVWLAWITVVFLHIFSPALVLLMAAAGELVFGITLFILLLSVLMLTSMCCMQVMSPKDMPETYRTWNFLPIYFRSIEPYDRIFTSCRECCCPIEKKFKPTTENYANNLEQHTMLEPLPGDSVSLVIDRLTGKRQSSLATHKQSRSSKVAPIDTISTSTLKPADRRPSHLIPAPTNVHEVIEISPSPSHSAIYRTNVPSTSRHPVASSIPSVDRSSEILTPDTVSLLSTKIDEDSVLVEKKKRRSSINRR